MVVRQSEPDSASSSGAQPPPGNDRGVGGRPAHVVMLVANDVATDTRVKKEALALAHAGLRVTIVGVASEATPARSMVGSVDIVRVPVDFAIRDEVLRRREAAVGRSIEPTGLIAWISARERALVTRSHIAAQHRLPGRVGLVRFKVGVVGRVLERITLRLLRRAARPYALARRLLHRATGLRRHQMRVRMRGPVRWREEHPAILDYEVALGPVIDSLEPDVLHAHDMHVIGIAAHASARARRRGKSVPWIYDAHEYVPGLSQYGGRTARVIEGWADLENEYIRAADRVITVSPAIAEALRDDYDLQRTPGVVLNIPTTDPAAAQRVTSLRHVCGVSDDVPLLCYSGGVTRARGVHTAVEAMTELDDAHLAVVCVPHNDTWYVRQVREQVRQLGLDGRVHLVNPVGPGEVVDFLRGVDVGLIPGLSFPSHEMSLPNKLFEYLHAGVPVVSSELRSLGAFLRETRTGLTFPVEDPSGLARSVRAVLSDHERFAAAAADPQLHARYSWSGQASELRRVYRDLLDRPLPVDEGSTRAEEELDLSEREHMVR